MKKLTFYEMVEMLEIYNNGYCDFNTARLKHNGIIHSGTVYRLCNELTNEQKSIFELFPNVVVGSRTCRQCPELHANVIFLSDTKLIN